MGRSDTNSLVYEIKPFLCGAVGVYSLSLQNLGGLGKLAGITLLGCAIAIIYLRARYRGLLR